MIDVDALRAWLHVFAVVTAAASVGANVILFRMVRSRGNDVKSARYERDNARNESKKFSDSASNYSSSYYRCMKVIADLELRLIRFESDRVRVARIVSELKALVANVSMSGTMSYVNHERIDELLDSLRPPLPCSDDEYEEDESDED